MDRYTMFYDYKDILDLKEHCDLQSEKKEYRFELLTEFDKLNNIYYNHGFSNPQELEGHALFNLSQFIDEMFDFVEVEIYNRINFTCEYLLNHKGIDKKSGALKRSFYKNALEYWEEFDKSINTIGESLTETFINNRHKLNLILSEHLVYDEDDNFIKVSKLCPKLGLYIFKNIEDLFWYDNNLKKSKDKFLVSRFLRAENCYFDDSEYYVFEWLTNINSVCIITKMLEDILPTRKAKMLTYSCSASKFLCQKASLQVCA